MIKDERLQIRISAKLKEKLEKVAREDNRTASNYVLNLIEKDLEGEKEMKKIKVLKKVETNSFADSSRSNNGGGYSQPLITFEFAGIKGEFKDSSAGEFGTRYEIRYGGKSYVYDSMSDYLNFTNFDMVEDAEFIAAVKEAFGVDITLAD